VAGTSECDELSGSKKCGEFLDWLKTSSPLKKDYAPCSKWVHKNHKCEIPICTKQNITQ